MAGLAVAAGAASCSRKEAAEAVQEPAEQAKVVAGKAADTKAGAGSVAAVESAAAEGVDLKKVEERTGAFQNILDSLQSYAGGGAKMSAERVDIESFVKGKTDSELLAYAQDAQQTRPYAAMQVLAYLLRQPVDPAFLIEVAGDYVDLIPAFGYEEDRQLALETYARIRKLYSDSDFVDALSLEQRLHILDCMQSHYVNLGVEYTDSLDRATMIRQHAGSDMELSIADIYEASVMFNRGDPNDEAAVRSLYEQVRARGEYNYLVQKPVVDFTLGMSASELAQHIQAVGRLPKGGLAGWKQLNTLSPEERLERVQQLETKE